MAWFSESLTGGVVKTREANMLDPGELVTAQEVRFKPGDLKQLWRGRGQSDLAYLHPNTSGEDVGFIEYLNFEGARDFILFVTSTQLTDDPGALYQNYLRAYDIDNDTVYTLDQSDGDIDEGGLASSGPDEGQAVHRGNEYFVGSSSKNWVVTAPADSSSAPGVREMGLQRANIDGPDQSTYRGPASLIVEDIDYTDFGLHEGQEIGSEFEEWLETIAEAYSNISEKRYNLGDFNNSRFQDAVLELAEQLGILSRLDNSRVPLRHHVFVYWYTEYDSTNDLESEASVPVLVVVKDPSTLPDSAQHPDRANTPEEQREGFGVKIIWDGARRANGAQADQVRVYRAWVGDVIYWYDINENPPVIVEKDDAGVMMQAQDMVNGDRGLVGGLIQTAEWGDGEITDYYYRDGWTNSPISYPLVSNVNRGVVKLDPFLVQPNPWILGAMFGDSLMTVDASVAQTVYYAFPGAPEYQPRTAYKEPILSERGDAIQGLAQLGDVAVVLTTSGCARFNYLAYEGETFRDKQQSWLSRRQGCVGRRAWDTVESEQGELMVWLSRQGLFASDGFSVNNLCRDFRVQDNISLSATLADCVLINDPRDFRLCLYVPGTTTTQRWDFYYENTLVKKAGLRVLGPHTVDGVVKDATRGSKDGEDRIFLLVSVSTGYELWLEGEGWAPKATISTRAFASREPTHVMRVRQWGFNHSDFYDGMVVEFTPLSWGLRSGSNANSTRKLAARDTGIHFSSLQGPDTFGSEHQAVFTVEAPTESGDWSIGPIWMDVEVGGGGHA